MSKKDSKLAGLTMKEGAYPPGGKPFYYCPTNDCGKCHGCTTGKKLDELVRPDLNDEEFEAHLESAVEGEVQTQVVGSLLAMGNGRSYQAGAISKVITDLGRPFNKPGITRQPILPIGSGWLHKKLITGGGFRHGELSMITAGPLNPLDRFKSNWLANYVSDFVARGPKPVDERSILQLFAEPEITGTDYYQRLRNLVNATYPVHIVRVPGSTRPEKIVKYIGATDHSSIPPSVRALERFVDPSPFIEVKGWRVWVGGKKILTLPFTMHDMIIDSITSREQMRNRIRTMPGTYGAYGQVTLEWPAGDYEYAIERVAVTREDWAEDAIDKLVYLQINGHAYGTNKNGDLVIPGRITTFGLQTARYHKMQARERLRTANYPERQKRGY